MDIFCQAGIHQWVKQRETPKFIYSVCNQCGATKRRYKAYCKPQGLRHRRTRSGGWRTTVAPPKARVGEG